MSETTKTTTSRRAFLKSTGRIAAASALATAAVPHVHAAENNTIQVALLGCGAVQQRAGFLARRILLQDRLEGGHGQGPVLVAQGLLTALE